jgi:hypothetical protein
VGSSPKQARKEEQKIQILPGNQKSESFFYGFNPEITTETSDWNFARDFE